MAKRKTKDLVIDDDVDLDLIFPNEKIRARGMEPRDFSKYPQEMFSPPTEIPLIPESEWGGLIDEQESKQSSLEHIWRDKGVDHLDQNGQGFCWCYSTAHTIMMVRARDNQETVRLSPHAVACKIKGFKDEGGWCGLSAEFARKTGYPTVKTWKEKSMSRAYDKPETWEEAAKYRISEDWVDLGVSHYYYQNLTFNQVATCLLMNMPCALDFNWWGHSVCGVRLVKVEKGSYGVRILNSWAGWGDKGFATLRGDKMYPNSALSTRAVMVD